MKKKRAGKSAKKLGKANSLRHIKPLTVAGPASRTGRIV
jgi:hypothetical protein